MSDKHKHLEEAGVVVGELSEHEKAAIEALDDDEHKELARILKKVKDKLPDDHKSSANFI